MTEETELIEIDVILAKTLSGTTSQVNKDILRYVQTLALHVRRLDEEVGTLRNEKIELIIMGCGVRPTQRIYVVNLSKAKR